MYLRNRFFAILGALIVWMAAAYALPQLYYPALVLLGLFVAATVADILLLYGENHALHATRTHAQVLSLSDPNEITVYIRNDGAYALRIHVIDELPPQFQERRFGYDLRLKPGEAYALSYQVRPVVRGEYAFGDILLFASTLLGLAERRIRVKASESVPVYPSIIQMKRIELRALRQISQEGGIKRMRRIGHSYEFEQIKNYVPGDDYRSINWKASARRGALMVNQYEEERSQQVYCVIDKSRVMRMPFEDMSLMDYAINTALALSNIILRKKDKAGLITFSNVLGAAIKADSHTAQLGRILESLYREKERSQEADFELLYEAVRRLIGARALLLLFTNFESQYALDRALPHLRRINRLHLLVVVFFENTEVQRLAEEEVASLSDIYRQVSARRYIYEKKEMVRRLRQYGIQAMLTRPQDLTLDSVNKYLELKARGLI
ncbi:MAG: DUF58 domain-containing protein [Saprospiraceae bacterium]